MEYRYPTRLKSQQFPLLSSWYDFGLWSAKKYRSWIHYSGPSPTFLVAVQGDWLCGGSQPRHCETASRLTNAKGAGSPANWQAGGLSRALCFPTDIQDFRTASQAKHKETATWSFSAHRCQRAAELLSFCESRFWAQFV